MSKVPILVGCQNDDCAIEVSYALDMVRMLFGSPICQNCYEEQDYGPRDDGGGLVTAWADLPPIKLTDLDLSEATPWMTNLTDFVLESNRIEGINRPATPKEIEAHRLFLSRPKVAVDNLEQFVTEVQPGAVLRRSSNLNVRVGRHTAPPGGPGIIESLELILARAVKIDHYNDVFRIHCDYEILHPFTDGNGRSGRVLWLWMMGGKAPLRFLHEFYYQTLGAQQ